MKRIFFLGVVIVATLNLMACAANSQSTVGVDCNYDGQPLGDMPLACQGSR